MGLSDAVAQDSELTVYGSGFRIQDSELVVNDSRFRVEDLPLWTFLLLVRNQVIGFDFVAASIFDSNLPTVEGLGFRV